MDLHEFNTLDIEVLKKEFFRCCGCMAWVKKMLTIFPVEDLVELLNDAEEKWYECSETDWLEAFAQHPRIGDVSELKNKFSSTAQWAEGEQAGAASASEKVLNELTIANKNYDKKFGFSFIVCATGKSANEMLELLNRRLNNERTVEINIAADEQNKITQLRLQKLLA